MPATSQLESSNFSQYPPQARHLAEQNVALLRHLPAAFTPFLLKEILAADAKFPAELRELNDQLSYLQALTPLQLTQEMKPFAGLTLNPALESFDWVNSPAQFLEQLSAHLWATHQMDTFRAASEAYVHRFHATLQQTPLPIPRAGIAVIGKDVADIAACRPLVKLQRQGVFYTKVNAANGLATLEGVLQKRQRANPAPYGHWSIHGGAAPSLPGFTTVSYQQLQPVRSALAARMLDAYKGQTFDPEMLRTTLARSTFESLNLKPSGDIALDQFSLTLLTEGSGTQIYSTTFVQWAAREALRRAQPLTLYAHYTPRIRERSMAEMLTGPAPSTAADFDPLGSLIDAGMGAYYTWLNQQRLPAADQSRFLVWLENSSQAVLIAPGQEPGIINHSATDLSVLANLALA